MSYKSIYCQAEHPHSPDGCYEFPEHKGQHRGITADLVDHFYWSDETPTPTPDTTFSQAEVGILLVTLEPVKQFFPELVKKLEGLR